MRKTRRLTVILVVVFFLAWLIPLGVFIKPAQENLACGGRRAVCLCSHGQAKAESKAASGGNIAGNPGNTNDPDSSGGSVGNYYLAAEQPYWDALCASRLNKPENYPYQEPAAESIEHVPKSHSYQEFEFLVAMILTNFDQR